MIFLDNFSKNISNRMFRADLGAYTSCQWTGRAIHPFVQEPGYACPSGEVKEISGAIVPAMPPDLDSTFSFVTELKQSLQRIYRRERNFYIRSIVVHHNVRCVPLKLFKLKVESFSTSKKTWSTDGIRRLLPQEMMPFAIGSNFGLVQVIQQLRREHKEHFDCRRYQNICADTNIFDRILSVRTLSSSAHGTLWYCSLYPRKVLGILGYYKDVVFDTS